MFINPLDKKPVTADHHVAGAYQNLSGVSGVDLYDGRGLPLHLGRPDDIVRIPDKLQRCIEVWAEYVKTGLGLTMPQIEYGDTPGQFLNGPNGHFPALTFKLGSWVLEHRPELKRAIDTVNFFENKTLFLEEVSTGSIKGAVSVPHTCSRETSDELSYLGPCWFKLTTGASGNGTVFCDDEDQFAHLLDDFQQAKQPFQIQQHIAGTDQSAQLFIDNQGARVLMTTDQIMGGELKSEHVGNIYPAYDAALVERVAQLLGDFVYQSGYRGFCGFDFVRCEATDQLYLLEMNARLTGAHYPGVLAGHLGFTQWRHIMVEGIRSGRLRTDPAQLIDHLSENGLLWTRKNQIGVVPWYIGTLPAGKAMLLIPGDRQQQEKTLTDFRYVCC